MFQDIKKNKIKTGAIIGIFIVIITLIIYYICMAFDLGYMSILIALIISIFQVHLEIKKLVGFQLTQQQKIELRH